MFNDYDFQARKAERKKEYEKKKELCSACNGSGYYDHNGSPKCSACNGKGKVKV